MVDIQDIQDEFGWGLVDPGATRRFLEYASRTWQVPPKFVVLAGRGTFDYRNIWGTDDNFVPPIFADSILGLVATDVAMTDFDHDGVPDIPIGRIPATSNSELQAYVSKLSAYENAAGGAWTTKAIGLADNAEGDLDFPSDALALEQVIHDDGRATIDSIHLGVAPNANDADARNALLASLNAGAYLFNFVGHGGFDRLTSEGLLLDSDASALGNSEKLPILTAQTCYVNYFAFPGYPAIGESLLLAGGGGVIASWAPGGLSVNAPAIDLGSEVVHEIAKLAGGRLGERIRAGLSAYLGSGGSRLNSTPYNLLGDPATELH